MVIDSMAGKLAKAIAIAFLCLRVELVSGGSMPAYLPKIDTHAHIIPTFYKDLLQAHNLTIAIREWNVSAHLATMAEYNIVTSVLSVTVPGAKFVEDEPVEVGRSLARKLNLYAQNLTVFYPKQFLFFATLTLPDLEGAVAEAIYAMDTLGAAGVILQANAFGELLGTRRYDPLYKVLNDRKAVVLVHSSLSPCPQPAGDAPPLALSPVVADFLLDPVRAAAELVLTEVTIDFPDITFILSNSGGFLPFAATRIANTLSAISGRPASELYEKLSNFSADLANSGTRTALPSTVAFFDESKLTYGTDYPYLLISVKDAALSVQIPPIPLSRKVIKKITLKNAYNLFKGYYR